MIGFYEGQTCILKQSLKLLKTIPQYTYYLVHGIFIEEIISYSKVHYYLLYIKVKQLKMH